MPYLKGPMKPAENSGRGNVRKPKKRAYPYKRVMPGKLAHQSNPVRTTPPNTKNPMVRS